MTEDPSQARRPAMASPARPVAIVTGSSSGIGEAVAQDLADHGWNIVVHGLTCDGVAEVADRVRETGAHAAVAVGDIRERSTVETLASTAIEAFGRIDGVVNNAGAGMTRDFQDIGDEDWHSILAMHLTSAAGLLRLAAPHLREARGSVVNVSSVAATRALPGRTAYGTAKAGLEGLTRSLAAEWADEGIRVNAVSPGTIMTPLVDTNLRTGLLDSAGVLDRTPLRRFGEPGEVASAVRFLLSHDASYVTGQTLSVDGGWSVWGGWR